MAGFEVFIEGHRLCFPGRAALLLSRLGSMPPQGDPEAPIFVFLSLSVQSQTCERSLVVFGVPMFPIMIDNGYAALRHFDEERVPILGLNCC